jgi:hypothetical protein
VSFRRFGPDPRRRNVSQMQALLIALDDLDRRKSLGSATRPGTFARSGLCPTTNAISNPRRRCTLHRGGYDHKRARMGTRATWRSERAHYGRSPSRTDPRSPRLDPSHCKHGTRRSDPNQETRTDAHETRPGLKRTRPRLALTQHRGLAQRGPVVTFLLPAMKGLPALLARTTHA